MATAEQMQEALQQQQHDLQVLGARIAALETQLQFESARAQQAEQERSTLIQSLGAMRPNRGDAMVDTKGTGQPFTLKKGADHDFGEWTHKARTSMLARFGDEILTALNWAARQQRIVVKTCVASQRNRFVPWKTRSTTLRRLCWNILCLPCIFYNQRSQQDRSELRRRKWLGSLETTAQRVRPDIVHETCGDPAAGPEPTALSAS